MINDLKFTIAQINPVVGDLEGNSARIKEIWAAQEDSDLILFPEMVISGYPTEDMVLRETFVTAVKDKIDQLIEFSKTQKPAVLVGGPWRQGDSLYNAAFLIEKGDVKIILKHGLPNYGVFEEVRVFDEGPLPEPVAFRGAKLGIMICWDFWFPDSAARLKELGAEILIVPNGSTYETTKMPARLHEGKCRTKETGLPLIYLNMIGGQDELVFDGASFAMNPQGEVVFQMAAFEEAVAMIDEGLWMREGRNLQTSLINYPSSCKAMYAACVLGLRDYVEKTGFKGVLLGLSGGIDSALTAVIAADALGAKRVRGVRLPSPFTSQESMDDAAEVAENLGIRLDTIPLTDIMAAYENSIPDLKGLAHENMQARSRGVVLMSLSNQSGEMLLSTGNKSELAVGYATLYGDMCGGFNPLKDVYKTKVYELSLLRNEWKPDGALGPDGVVIPTRILTKAPTAELKDNQLDQDTLPPYDMLDKILEGFIENERSIEEMIADGFDEGVVREVYRMLHRSEYKRRQAAPGVNVTPKSFGGRARRYPMVNRF